MTRVERNKSSLLTDLSSPAKVPSHHKLPNNPTKKEREKTGNFVPDVFAINCLVTNKQINKTKKTKQKKKTLHITFSRCASKQMGFSPSAASVAVSRARASTRTRTCRHKDLRKLFSWLKKREKIPGLLISDSFIM